MPDIAAVNATIYFKSYISKIAQGTVSRLVPQNQNYWISYKTSEIELWSTSYTTTLFPFKNVFK